MSRDRFQLLGPSVTAEVAARRESVVVLAVGELREWENRGNMPPTHGNLAFVSFGDLSRALLEHYSPSMVFSPALGRTFDCIDLAVKLCDAKFQGSYRATAIDLPRPDVIEREVKLLCPGLDFRIVDAAWPVDMSDAGALGLGLRSD